MEASARPGRAARSRVFCAPVYFESGAPGRLENTFRGGDSCEAMGKGAVARRARDAGAVHVRGERRGGERALGSGRRCLELELEYFERRAVRAADTRPGLFHAGAGDGQRAHSQRHVHGCAGGRPGGRAGRVRRGGRKRARLGGGRRPALRCLHRRRGRRVGQPRFLRSVHGLQLAGAHRLQRLLSHGEREARAGHVLRQRDGAAGPERTGYERRHGHERHVLPLHLPEGARARRHRHRRGFRHERHVPLLRIAGVAGSERV